VNFPFFIARRYFSTKKNSNFVHIISWVSLLGVAIGTAALILVLSGFNGLEDLVLKNYNSLNPHLHITAAEGKVFSPEKISDVLDNPEFESFAYILEEEVLLKYQEKESIATVKGVSETYQELTRFDNLLVEGKYINSDEDNNEAVVGWGVVNQLSISLEAIGPGTMPVQLQVFLPNRNASAQQILNKSEDALNTDKVLPVGIFSTKTAEIDQRYIITPLAFIQQLADRGNSISSIEINLKNENRMLVIQEQLATALGDDFIVKNCFEQQELLYKIVNTERLATFLIIAFIMIIAAFNIIGALSMLMLDKQKDIITLKSLGCTVQDIQSIFFRKSMLTILLGIGTGLFIGLGLAFLQQTFGFIGMGSGIYPVTVVFTDIILVSLSVFSVGLLVSWYPAKVLSSKLFKN